MQALKHLSRIHVGLSLSSQPHWIQGTAYSHSCVYYLLVSQCRFAQRSQPSYCQHLLRFIHVYWGSDTHCRFLLVSGMHVLSHTHVGLFSLSSRSQWMQCTAYSHACAYHTPSSVIVFSFSVCHFIISLSACSRLLCVGWFSVQTVVPRQYLVFQLYLLPPDLKHAPVASCGHHVGICSVGRFVLPNMVFKSWRVGVNLFCYVSSTIPLQGNPIGLAYPCCVVHMDMYATCRCEPRCHAELGRHSVCASSATACQWPA